MKIFEDHLMRCLYKGSSQKKFKLLKNRSLFDSLKYTPSDYAVKIFFDAVEGRVHECYLKPDARLPMIYIDDCLNGIIKMLEVPSEALSLRTYNMAGMCFTPEEVFASIQKHKPDFKIEYKVCPVRQAIADSWPESLDDSNARKDWGFKTHFDLDRTTSKMLKLLRGVQEEDMVESKNILGLPTDDVKTFPAESLLRS